mmetsp:Transcript_2508/g.5760  ORF Transcript_2508/g.5760 Transcript_2508/m.5760 type:complete len:122 (-) Transcript_2508:1139-1504(-)
MNVMEGYSKSERKHKTAKVAPSAITDQGTDNGPSLPNFITDAEFAAAFIKYHRTNQNESQEVQETRRVSFTLEAEQIIWEEEGASEKSSCVDTSNQQGKEDSAYCCRIGRWRLSSVRCLLL